MNKRNILLCLFFIFIAIIVIYGLLSLYNFGELTCGIKVEKLNYIPDDFIEITDQDLDNYSLLKKAVETEEIVKDLCRETNQIHKHFNDINYFKYKENYYEIHFYST